MQSSKVIKLAGVFPPIPTPFTPEGAVDLHALEMNFSKWNEQPLTGYVVGGSNGEFVTLSTEERVEVVTRARQLAPNERVLIAGSGMESTRGTVEMAQRLAEIGVDALLVVTPSYYKSKMDSAALVAHYQTVAEGSSLPLILYSVPANTGVDISVDAVEELSKHPKIVGIKDSGGDVTKLGEMVFKTPDDFQVLAGSGGFLLGALAVGAVGAIAGLANIAAGALAEIVACFSRGDINGACAIQHPLIEVNRAVTAQYGVAGLKAAMDMLGYYGGPVRAPLLPLSKDAVANLRVTLEKGGLL
jgi:4-hydroxy-2-oxoglutarate aldolase